MYACVNHILKKLNIYLLMWYFRSNSSFDRDNFIFRQSCVCCSRNLFKHAGVEDVCVVVEACSSMQLYKLVCWLS